MGIMFCVKYFKTFVSLLVSENICHPFKTFFHIKAFVFISQNNFYFLQMPHSKICAEQKHFDTIKEYFL